MHAPLTPIDVPSLRRRFALLAAFGLFAALLVTHAVPASASHYQLSLEGSDFEIDNDANLVVDQAGMDDWASVNETRKADKASGSNDDSFTQGADEQTPVPAVSTGSIPPSKSDLKHFGVYTEPGTPGFLHMFWTRVQEPTGTTNMDFEFNQKSCVEGGDQTGCSANGVTPVRSVGDMLITYNLSSGGTDVSLWLHRWITSGTCEDSQEGGSGGKAATAEGCWDVGQSLTDSIAAGSINTSAISSAAADGLGSLSARTFGEASVDLGAIFGGDSCFAFGSAYLKSRSSDTFTSALKDFIAPAAVDISNCGTITIEKETDPDGRPESFDFTTEGGLTPASFSLQDDGSQTFTNVFAGTYRVAESDPSPAEFVSIVCTGGSTEVDPDGDNPREVEIVLAADEDITCTYTNKLVGSILVHKVDSGNSDALLAGAGFTIDPGTPSDASDDITMTEDSDGVFCTDGLAFDDYTVTESTVPDGYIGADPQDFTVDSTKTCADKIADDDSPDLTFGNSPAPGRINIFKSDDDGAPLNGAVFTLYTDDGEGDGFDPVDEGDPDAEETAVATCTTGMSNSDGSTAAAGTCSFINVDTGDYWVDETTVPTGYSKAAGLPTQVAVGLGSSPGTGQTINLPSDTTSFVDPQTHKLIVIVCHEGVAKLAASDVDTDGDPNTVELTTLAEGSANESTLCALDGVSGLPHGDKSITVDVGSDAHPTP